MNAKVVVAKLTPRSAATVKAVTPSSRVLASSLAVLLLVIATAACGRTTSQPPGAHSTSAQQQTCFRVGQDSCYYYLAPGAGSASDPGTCFRVGQDSCYMLIPSR